MRALLKLVSQFMLVAICFVALGCGGAQNTNGVSQKGNENGGDADISGETLDELKRFFDRKRVVASRCFVAAWEKDMKAMGGAMGVYATITLRILPGGSAKNVHVAESSAKSEMLNTCLVGLVKKWSLPNVETALDYSYSFSFDRL